MPPLVELTNNYPMAEARAGWRAGAYPAQHLYGTDALEAAGASVVDLRSDRTGRLHRVSRWTGWQLGDLEQELAVLGARGPDAVVFGAEAQSVQLLLLLRRLRLPLPPVVVVVHELPVSPIGRQALRGAARIISISSKLTDELVAAGIGHDRVVTLPWGPDLHFPGYELPVSEEVVLSTGKSRRDLATLLAALEGLDVPATVFAADGMATGAAPNSRARVVASVAGRATGAPLTYAHVLPELRRAAVVAIPLRPTRRPNGLTELNDALALAKPVVITDNPYLDCDVETIGCGVRVGAGDVAGWRRAISRLMADADERREMGRRGRAWAEERCNASIFGAGVRAVVEEVWSAGRFRPDR
jgi:glycosyltransferase involved in cell wall biosynthesis